MVLQFANDIGITNKMGLHLKNKKNQKNRNYLRTKERNVRKYNKLTQKGKLACFSH